VREKREKMLSKHEMISSSETLGGAEMLNGWLASKIERKDLTEKRMICSFEKKNDFEQTLISNVLSFA
jgi:hypothetical protein